MGVALGQLNFPTPRTQATRAHVGRQSGYLSPSCGNSHRRAVATEPLHGGATELLVLKAKGRQGL